MAAWMLYHGSPFNLGGGVLEPRASKLLGGEEAVYATNVYELAVLFVAKHTDADIDIGFHCGRLYVIENWPGAFERHLCGAAGYVYTLRGEAFGSDPRLGMPEHEFVCREPVPVCGGRPCERIDDVHAFLAGARSRANLISYEQKLDVLLGGGAMPRTMTDTQQQQQQQ